MNADRPHAPRRWRIRKQHGLWTVAILRGDPDQEISYYLVKTARESWSSACAYVQRVEDANYGRKAA